jgi:hypothetical protein
MDNQIMETVDVDHTCKAGKMLPHGFAAMQTDWFIGSGIGKFHHAIFGHHFNEAIGGRGEIVAQCHAQKCRETGQLVWT